MKPKITFERFTELEKELEIRIGKVLKVEEVPKSARLLKLTVDFGGSHQTVVTNTKAFFMNSLEPRPLEGESFNFVVNLEPSKIMGIESTAMILPGEIERGLTITSNSPAGTKLL